MTLFSGKGAHTPVTKTDVEDRMVAGEVESSIWTPEQITAYLSEKYGRRASEPPQDKPPVMMDFDMEQAKKRMPR